MFWWIYKLWTRSMKYWIAYRKYVTDKNFINMDSLKMVVGIYLFLYFSLLTFLNYQMCIALRRQNRITDLIVCLDIMIIVQILSFLIKLFPTFNKQNKVILSFEKFFLYLIAQFKRLSSRYHSEYECLDIMKYWGI